MPLPQPGPAPSRGVLIVDDRPAVRHLLAAGLEWNFDPVVGCASAAEALEEGRRRRFDVVMVGLRPPGVGQLVEALRSGSPNAAVVVVAGEGSDLTLTASLAHVSVDGVLRMPCPLHEIEAFVDAVLARRLQPT